MSKAKLGTFDDLMKPADDDVQAVARTLDRVVDEAAGAVAAPAAPAGQAELGALARALVAARGSAPCGRAGLAALAGGSRPRPRPRPRR